MTPADLMAQLLGQGHELAARHLRQLVVVDDRPAAGVAAPDDIAGRRLVALFPVETAPQIDGGRERGPDLPGACRRDRRQDGG